MAEPFSDEVHKRALKLMRGGWKMPFVEATLLDEFGVSPSQSTLRNWKKADQVKRGIRCRYCHRNDWHNGTLCRTCGYDEITGRFELDNPLVRDNARHYH